MGMGFYLTPAPFMLNLFFEYGRKVATCAHGKNKFNGLEKYVLYF